MNLDETEVRLREMTAPLVEVAVSCTDKQQWRAADTALLSVAKIYREAGVKNRNPDYRWASWWLFRRWESWKDAIKDRLAEALERELEETVGCNN